MATRGQRNSNAPIAPILLVQLGIVFFLFFLGKSYELLQLPPARLITPTSWLTVISTVWALWSWKRLTGSGFDPYVIFFLTATLFNAGQVILEIFHLNRDGILNGTFSTTTVFRTLVLTATGLAAFHLGAIISVALYHSRRKNTGQEKVLVDYSSALTIVGYALLAISSGPTFVQLRNSIGVARALGYSALYQESAATGIDAGSKILGNFIVPAAILILLGSRGKRLPMVISMFVVVTFALTQLFLGFRAYAVMPLAAYAWAFHRTIRPLPKSFVLGTSAGLLFVVFPLVRTVRNLSGSDKFNPLFLWKSYTSIDNPAVSTIAELGGSMQASAYTIELVPSLRPFDHGLSYAYAALAVVPNVFGGVHPSIARGTASSWLTWTVSPWNAANGGGLGYSFIAEAYLNFGWSGSILLLCAVGMMFGSLFFWAIRSKSILVIGFAACFLSFLTHYARGEAFTVLRPLIWYSVVPLLSVRMLASLLEKSRAFARVPSKSGLNASNSMHEAS